MTTKMAECKNCKQSFGIEPDDFAFYERIAVPPPTWCPTCRRLRRLGWCGYRILYKRKCDFTGESIISFHHQNSPYKIYRQDIWWSDKWDPRDYGRDYDFSKPFFEQYRELLRETPLPSLHTSYATMVNSDYCNGAAKLKNCYLCFKTDNAENSAYLNTTTEMKDTMEASYSNFDELCYEILYTNKCYRSFYSEDCESSHDIYFSKDLVGCSHCIGCIGLRNKNYHVFNRPCSKEEFVKALEELNFGSCQAVQTTKKKAQDHFLKFPRKAMHGRNNVNVSGDYLFNSKNVHDAYMAGNAENVRYSELLKAGPTANAYDYTMFGGAEWMYESVWIGLGSSMAKGSFWNYTTNNIEYCFGCHGSNNLFGCVGVRSGEYCVLNKQYSKKEYKEIAEKIREHMKTLPFKDVRGREYWYGDFFPVETSPWTYNESHAMEFFPLTKQEAETQGFSWRELDRGEYREATIEIPDNIKDVSNDILDAILKCDMCGKNYLVIRMELDFYRRFGIPVPHACPLCRDRARVAKLNPMKVYDRICMKCNVLVKSTHSPNHPEIVYCEQCYTSEVV